MKKTLLLSLLAVSSLAVASSLETKVEVEELTDNSRFTIVEHTTKFELDLPKDIKFSGAIKYGNEFVVDKRTSHLGIEKKFGKYGTFGIEGQLRGALVLVYKNEYKFNENSKLYGGVEYLSKIKNAVRGKKAIVEEARINGELSPLLAQADMAAFLDPNGNIPEDLKQKIEALEKERDELLDGQNINTYLLANMGKVHLGYKYESSVFDLNALLSYRGSYDNYNLKDHPTLSKKVVSHTPFVSLEMAVKKGTFKFDNKFVTDNFITNVYLNKVKSQNTSDLNVLLVNGIEYGFKKEKATITPRFELSNNYTARKNTITANNQSIIDTEKTYVLSITPSIKGEYKITDRLNLFGKAGLSFQYTKGSVILEYGQNKQEEKHPFRARPTKLFIEAGFKYTW